MEKNFERWRRTLRDGERGNCIQDILYEKRIYFHKKKGGEV